jgi:DNA-binding winged helix-turn-helix (wHTH) protein
MIDTAQEPPSAKGRADAVSYYFGGFAFDPMRGVVRHPGGAEVSLRPKSADLLHHLAQHATQLVGRDELMDAVWPGVSVTDDSITHCVT